MAETQRDNTSRAARATKRTAKSEKDNNNTTTNQHKKEGSNRITERNDSDKTSRPVKLARTSSQKKPSKTYGIVLPCLACAKAATTSTAGARALSSTRLAVLPGAGTKCLGLFVVLLRLRLMLALLRGRDWGVDSLLSKERRAKQTGREEKKES
jgi:hypothetical protein